MKHFEKTNIYLGNQFELTEIPKNWVKIHVGGKFYPKTIKQLTYKTIKDLYINWEDSSDENDFNIHELLQILDFMTTHKDDKLFIHCEYAQSRSPAVVMTYLAKRAKFLPNNFFGALEEFAKLYPDFVFPSGITKFLKKNWKFIN
jgi:protein tyrosine phosphatase